MLHQQLTIPLQLGNDIFDENFLVNWYCAIYYTKTRRQRRSPDQKLILIKINNNKQKIFEKQKMIAPCIKIRRKQTKEIETQKENDIS